VLRIATKIDAVVLGYPPTMFKHLDRVFAQPAIETLVRLDEAGRPQPWLATGWKVDAKAKTVTLTLRKGVKFHDGTDFNAQAVKWNFEQYMSAKRGELANVKSIEVVDDYTVRLHLSAMDNLLIPNLATAAGMMISPTACKKYGKEWAETHPVGTGPFKLVSWQRGVRQVYEKFDGYWQKGKPYLRRVEWVVIADPMVQMAAFQKGEVEAIIDLDPTVAQSLEARRAYRITKTKIPMQVWGLFPDSVHSDSPLSKLKVRQAIWHAIDAKAICSTIGRGYWTPINQIAVPGSWAYNPKVKGYPYNPAKAKQLLTEAGYPRGFKITIYGLSSSPNPDVMAAVQQYLRQVGIQADVDAMDPGRYDKMVAGGGGWSNGLTLLSSSVVPNELAIAFRLLGSKVHKARLPVVFDPKEFQQLADAAVVAPDEETMKSLVHRMQEVGTDKHAMIIWLYATTGIAAKQPYVQNDGLFEVFYTQWTPADARISFK
jgi:ABC-type transport system substrate-binding protein